MEIDSFNKKIVVHRDKLFRFGYSLLQNREEAEDALQEVFIKMWSQKDRLSQIRNTEAYAMKLMKNLCLDRLRYFKNKKMISLDSQSAGTDNFTPFTSVSFNDLKGLMLKLFSVLPEQQRMIIHMRDIEHYSFEEIQEVTGLPINNIRVILSRARQNVKSSYQKIKSYESGRNQNLT